VRAWIEFYNAYLFHHVKSVGFQLFALPQPDGCSELSRTLLEYSNHLCMM
jgi:hypothetical protein